MANYPLYTTQRRLGVNNPTKHISSLSAFPDAASDVIILEANTDYIIEESIISSSRFVIPDGSINNFLCEGIQSKNLIYVGTGDLFTVGSGSSFALQNLVTIAPTASNVFEVDGASQIILDYPAIISAPSIGNFANITTVLFVKNAAFIGCSDGFELDNITALTFQGNNFAGWSNTGGTFIRYKGSGTFSSTLLALNNFAPGSSETVLDIENTATYTNGQIIGNSYTGVGTFFDPTGLDQTDLAWNVVANSGYVATSGVFGTAFFSNNTTETVIGAAGTPVAIAGTTTGATLERMTHSSPNLTYIGLEPTTLRAEAYVTVEVTNDLETDDVNVYIYVDGVQFPATISSKTLGTVFQNPTVDFLAIGDVPVLNGQVIEARIENASNPTNILVTDYKLIVRK